MDKTRVSIVKTGPKPEYPEIRQAVEKAFDLIGGIQDLVKPGFLVLIKPSWVAFPVERDAACIRPRGGVTSSIVTHIKRVRP